MMVKKFASITAMAKTDKRTSKTRLTSPPISNSNDQKCEMNDARFAVGAVPSSIHNRVPPSRSLSLRETRNSDSSPSQNTGGSIFNSLFSIA